MSKNSPKSIRIFIECSPTYFFGGNTGIQRVVRNIVNNCNEVAGDLKVECFPVVWYGKNFVIVKNIKTTRKIIRKLQQFIKGLLIKCGIKKIFFMETRFFLKQMAISILYLTLFIAIFFKKKAQFGNSDILLISDSFWNLFPIDGIRAAKKKGAGVGIILYDLMPLRFPQFYEKNLVFKFKESFEQILPFLDFCISISAYIKNDFLKYLESNATKKSKNIKLDYFKVGMDLDLSKNNSKIKDDLLKIFNEKGAPRPYLVVGTIEPRKNHNYILDAFELLWLERKNVRLCILGRIGWTCDDIVRRIENHPQKDKLLYMVNDVNDAELAFCYKNSKALIAASVCEGFDIPVVEALCYGLPVLASDIPIHREVGKDYCIYFDLNSPDLLAKLVKDSDSNNHFFLYQKIKSFYWPDWKESTRELFKKIIDIHQKSL